MRPPEFTGGKGAAARVATAARAACFNEAAGIHRRKGAGTAGKRRVFHGASMRPPEFTGGKSRGRFRRGQSTPLQ